MAVYSGLSIASRVRIFSWSCTALWRRLRSPLFYLTSPASRPNSSPVTSPVSRDWPPASPMPAAAAGPPAPPPETQSPSAFTPQRNRRRGVRVRPGAGQGARAALSGGGGGVCRPAFQVGCASPLQPRSARLIIRLACVRAAMSTVQVCAECHALFKCPSRCAPRFAAGLHAVMATDTQIALKRLRLFTVRV